MSTTSLTSSLHWLLKLPPTLRSYAVQPLTTRSLRGKTYEQVSLRVRHFSNARTLQAKKSKVQKTPRPPPSSKKPPQPSQPSQQDTTTIRVSPPSFSRVDPTLRQVLAKTPEILLYRAGNHTSFFIHSYLIGLIFIGGGVMHAQLIDEDRPPPWYVRTVNVGIACFLAMAGTAFILAPSKLIRSVHLVAPHTPQGQPLLRFRTRASLPLIQRFRSSQVYNIEAPLGEVQIEDKVSGDDCPYHSIPISRAEEFTNLVSHPPKLSISQHLREFGHSVRNYPKILWQDTRRMFVRDGFAYLQIPDTKGYWKLDIHGSYLLEHGQPLAAAMITVDDLDRSVLGRIQRMFFSSRE